MGPAAPGVTYKSPPREGRLGVLVFPRAKKRKTEDERASWILRRLHLGCSRLNLPNQTASLKSDWWFEDKSCSFVRLQKIAGHRTFLPLSSESAVANANFRAIEPRSEHILKQGLTEIIVTDYYFWGPGADGTTPEMSVRGNPLRPL